MSTLAEQVRELERRNEALSRLLSEEKARMKYWNGKYHEMRDERAAAESRLAQARVEGAREALTRIAEMGQDGKWERTVKPDSPFRPHWMEIAGFRDREYPAVPEGGEYRPKITCADHGYCVAPTGCNVGKECFVRPTPTPERVSDMYLHVQTIGVQTLTEDGYKRIEQTVVRVTPQDAKALVSLAAQDGGSRD